MMQTDVRSAHSNVSALLYAGRARLKGVLFHVSDGAPLDHLKFYDAATATGSVILEIDSNHSGGLYIQIPGEGILFKTSIYCDIGDADSVTIFYG
jgi:hypothetical protein